MRLAAALFLSILAVSATAQTAPVPRERAPSDAQSDLVGQQQAIPMPRPRPQQDGPEPHEAEPATGIPQVPPPRVHQAACPAVLLGWVEASTVPPIAAGRCEVASPLLVSAVRASGRTIPLSSNATLTCGMAHALRDWIEAIDLYLAAREGTRIASVLIGTSYACRPRNNAPGAVLSEHGFGNALDVVGFELADGRTVSFPTGWLPAQSPAGRLLRFAHDSGCTLFTTTLGPEANALHEDHLHLDLGCHGANCVTRLCE